MPHSRFLPVTGATLLAVGLAAVAAAPAGAQSPAPGPQGSSILTLRGSVPDRLSKQKVRITAGKPASRKGSVVTLPTSGGAINAKGTGGTVEHGGTIKLQRGSRSLVLSAPVLRIGSASSLRATVGKRSQALFVVRRPKGSVRLNGLAQTATIQNVYVNLTSGGAKVVNRALRLSGSRAIRPGRFATLTTNAVVRAPASGPVAPAAPTVPLDRPATAVPVAAATVVWRQRSSWLQYIHSGRGTAADGGTTALEGAVAGPVESLPTAGNGDPVAIPYTYSFPFTSGWYDPISGQAAVDFAGALRHKFPAHGIDMYVRNPSVLLNGATSSVAATVGGTAGSVLTEAQGTYVSLDASASPRTQSGNVVTITGIPGRVPTGAGDGVFKGFYPDGDAYGSIDTLQLTLGQ